MKKREWVVPLGKFVFSDEMKDAIADVFLSGRITEGKYVKLFEKSWADYIGVKHCIAVNSGTSALLLSYIALKERGVDTVIVPATTFTATLNPAAILGMKFFVKDVNENMLFDWSDENTKTFLESGGNPKKTVFVPVHLFGYPVDMVKLRLQTRDKNFLILEDCAESHGTMFDGKRVGSMGICGTFSFYPSHNLQAGEMGCVTTNDDEFAERIRSLKDNGRDHSVPGYVHDSVGLNCKTTELTAALAYCQVSHAQEIMDKRYRISSAIIKGLGGCVSCFPVMKNMSIMALPLGAKTSEERGLILKALNKAGVETRLMFPALTHQKPFLSKDYAYPNASRFEESWFAIPCHQFMNKKDCKLIVDTIREATR